MAASAASVLLPQTVVYTHQGSLIDLIREAYEDNVLGSRTAATNVGIVTQFARIGTDGYS